MINPISRFIILPIAMIAAACASLRAQDTTVIPLATINTPNLEYAPTVTADGRTLYFVSDRPGGSGGHDIWFATKEDRRDSVFTRPVNAGPGVNTPLNEGVAAISADGQTMYFTACNRADGVGDCDIYEAELDGTTWKLVRDLTELNSPYWDSQPSISSDGRTLFFVSNREGALGGNGDVDIWFSTRRPDGRWSKPEHPGAPINSPSREDSPFILPGGEALYFSSARPGGFGGLDFYVARKTASGVFGTPRNLGPRINSADDDRFITLPASADVIYFTAKRGMSAAGGKLDLMMALIPPPVVTVLVAGRVYDRATGAGIPADLVLVDSASGNVLSGTVSNGASGEYSFVMNAGESSVVEIYGVAPGYGPIRERIAIPASKNYSELRVDLPLNGAVASAPKSAAAIAPPGITISPNPATTTITIENTSPDAAEDLKTVAVDDIYGNRVMTTNLSGRRAAIDVARLPNGIYLARIGDYSVPFVVRK